MGSPVGANDDERPSMSPEVKNFWQQQQNAKPEDKGPADPPPRPGVVSKRMSLLQGKLGAIGQHLGQEMPENYLQERKSQNAAADDDISSVSSSGSGRSGSGSSGSSSGSESTQGYDFSGNPVSGSPGRGPPIGGGAPRAITGVATAREGGYRPGLQGGVGRGLPSARPAGGGYTPPRPGAAGAGAGAGAPPRPIAPRPRGPPRAMGPPRPGAPRPGGPGGPRPGIGAPRPGIGAPRPRGAPGRPPPRAMPRGAPRPR